MARTHVSLALLALLGGCGGGVTPTDGGGTDSSTRTDMAGGGDMATGGDMSTGIDMSTATDMSTMDEPGLLTDMGPLPVDLGPVGDGAVMCSAGVMCLGFPGTTGYPLGSTTGGPGTPMYANCVGLIHQTDCCGARRVYGANHAARGAPYDFCTAEAACRAQYMSPASCSDTTITTDSGETTMDINQVRVNCDPASPAGTCTCHTIVCTTDVCRAGSGAIGTCGP